MKPFPFLQSGTEQPVNFPKARYNARSSEPLYQHENTPLKDLVYGLDLYRYEKRLIAGWLRFPPMAQNHRRGLQLPPKRSSSTAVLPILGR